MGLLRQKIALGFLLGAAFGAPASAVSLLPDATDFLVEPLGATELRGRAAPVEVFAVARRA